VMLLSCVGGVGGVTLSFFLCIHQSFQTNPVQIRQIMPLPLLFFPSFLPSFFSPTCFLCLRLCLHTHCSCRGLLWHLIIFRYTNTRGRNRTTDGLSQRPLPDKTQRGSFFPIIYLLRRHLTFRRRIIRGTDGVVKWNEVQWR